VHFNVHGVFDALCAQQNASAAIATIFRVILLLQQYNGKNVVSCVAVAL